MDRQVDRWNIQCIDTYYTEGPSGKPHHLEIQRYDDRSMDYILRDIDIDRLHLMQTKNGR